MRKKTCLIILWLALFLAGCGSAPEAVTAADAPSRRVTPAPGALEPAAEPDVLASGRGDGTKAQVAYTTAEETACWQVESWKIYTGWAAAGVDTEELIVSDAKLGEVLLAEDGGGMLIARMRYTNETTYTEGEAWRYVDEMCPAVDGKSAGSGVVWFPERAQDVIDGGPWGTAFYIPGMGKSAVLTLGFVLTPEAVTAARSGGLALMLLEGGGTLPLTPD